MWILNYETALPATLRSTECTVKPHPSDHSPSAQTLTYTNHNLPHSLPLSVSLCVKEHLCCILWWFRKETYLWIWQSAVGKLDDCQTVLMYSNEKAPGRHKQSTKLQHQCVYLRLYVCLFHGENEWENNRLKRKTCLRESQRKDGKMCKLVGACVCLCVCTCVWQRIYL